MAYVKYLDMGGAIPTLKDGTLKYSNPTSFADAFDMSFEVSISYDTNNVRRLMRAHLCSQKFRQKVAQFNNKPLDYFDTDYLAEDDFGDIIVDGLLGNLNRSIQSAEAFFNKISPVLGGEPKIACFTKSALKPIMWTLHAGRHEGIALEFEAPKEEALLREVKYYPEPPSLLTDEELIKMMYEHDFSTIKRITKRVNERLAYTKHIDWKFEEELRLMRNFKDNHYNKGGKDCPTNLPFDPCDLRAIYLGLKMNEQHKKRYNVPCS